MSYRSRHQSHPSAPGRAASYSGEFCYLVAMLAIDSVPEMLLDEDPRHWERTEGTLEAMARTFPDEIARLRVLILQARCRGQGEANVQALTVCLVDTFIVGESSW